MAAECLLTNADLNACIDDSTMLFSVDGYTTNVLPKLLLAGELFEKNYIIDANQYPVVYITSDIHADFRKFIQILQNAGLIAITKNPYSSEIYDPDMITQTTWIGAPGTLVIIVGDIVDGSRGGDKKVADVRGSFEWLLHCFLHNLRIQALLNKSDVRFTIGNHDYTTVLGEEAVARKYGQYVTLDAKIFFQSHPIRQTALVQFYKNCPFYLLTIENGLYKEVACVHGGLHHWKDESNLTAPLVRIQENIANGGDPYQAYNAEFAVPGTMDPIMTRLYEDKAGGQCGLLDRYKMVVVGHCTTPSLDIGRFKWIHWTDDAFADCDRFAPIGQPDAWETRGFPGCVLLDCDEEGTEYPKLAYVDTASSQAFRAPGKNNELRKVQVLVLRHDAPAPQFYNRVERITLGGPSPTVITVWPQPGWMSMPPTAGGGKRRSKKTRSKRLRKNKSRRS